MRLIIPIAFGVICLRGHYVWAPPITDVMRRSSSSCDDLHRCRTIWSIIWSCVATIFSCTWVALHPNIPGLEETTFGVLKRRAQLMLLTFLAPELIIMWAMRQWFVASRLAQEHQAPGEKWTQTHGFFALMGGFVMKDNDPRKRYVLGPGDLEKFVFPDIEEDDIKDRSKGDILTKGLVLLQTGWFIIQCIARGVERLPLTELELVTLAFAALNLTTYAFWWNKPLNVQRPIAVMRRPWAQERNVAATGGKEKGQGAEGQEQGTGSQTRRDKLSYIMIQTPIRKLDDLVIHIGGTKETDHLYNRLRVPTFYAGDLTKRNDTDGTRSSDKNIVPRRISFLITGVAVVFGSIHCIAWQFSFSSHEVQRLWRVSSIVLICVPVIHLLRYLLTDPMNRLAEWWFPFKLLQWVLLFFVSCTTALYVIARVMLLVIALMSLNTLPPGAYQTVHWTTFIPHI